MNKKIVRLLAVSAMLIFGVANSAAQKPTKARNWHKTKRSPGLELDSKLCACSIGYRVLLGGYFV
jgi:hypothetical protein